VPSIAIGHGVPSPYCGIDHAQFLQGSINHIAAQAGLRVLLKRVI
jgi:hypothetical protein